MPICLFRGVVNSNWDSTWSSFWRKRSNDERDQENIEKEEYDYEGNHKPLCAIKPRVLNSSPSHNPIEKELQRRRHKRCGCLVPRMLGVFVLFISVINFHPNVWKTSQSRCISFMSVFLHLLFNFTCSRWTSSLPSCLWSLRIFPSLPGSRLTIFYHDASSALLQLVNQWLKSSYSRSHAFRYERKNTNPPFVRIELTASALAGGQVTY